MVSDLLTIAYVLLSVAATLLVTLLSTTLERLHFVLFFCAVLIFAIAGAICLYIGWRTRESVRGIVSEIKNRMPPPPAIREAAATDLIESASRIPPNE